MSSKNNTTTVVDTLRTIERALLGSTGLTIARLRQITGCSRRQIDRHLQTLRELGCGLQVEDPEGRHPALWSVHGRTVFVHQPRKRVARG